MKTFEVGGLKFQRLMSGSVRIGEGSGAITVTASQWNSLVADLARAAELPLADTREEIRARHAALMHHLCGCSVCISVRRERQESEA